MSTYATAERSDGEEDQKEQDPEDDRYRQLQEKIHQRDETIASMAAKMEAMMEQL